MTFLDLACVSVIFLYGRYRRDHPEFTDPLSIKLPLYDLDCWSITHFCFNCLKGYLFPTMIAFAMSMGIIWELFELIYGRFQPKILNGLGGNRTNGIWWYAKLSDPIVNLLGFSVGMAISYFICGSPLN